MTLETDRLDKLSRYSEYGSAGASVLAPTGNARAALAAEDAAIRTGAVEASALAEAEAGIGAAAGGASGGLWNGIKSFAGLIATPLMLLAGAFQTAKAVKQKDGHAAAEAAGSTVGGVAGMWAGGALGTAITAAEIFSGPIGWLTALVVGIGTTIAGSWVGSKAADGMVGNRWHQSLNGEPLKPTRMMVPAGYHLETLPAGATRPGFFTQRLQQERAEKQNVVEGQIPQPGGMGH